MNDTIAACSYERWGGRFPGRTVRGQFVAVPDAFKVYMLKDDFVVDTDMFPDLKTAVEDAIKELGGKAFVKMNYTAPTDAQWIGPSRTLTVRTFEDVMYLLKGSCRVMIDLTTPFGESVEPPKPIIVLKKWFIYDQEREFRVFYKSEGVLAVSSRYSHIACVLERDEVESLVVPFIEEVAATFPKNRLVLDVYISPKMRPHLIDVQPWCEVVSTGLYTWDELDAVDALDVRLCDRPVISRNEEPAVPVELQGGAALAEVMASLKEFDEIPADIEAMLLEECEDK